MRTEGLFLNEMQLLVKTLIYEFQLLCNSATCWHFPKEHCILQSSPSKNNSHKGKKLVIIRVG